MVLSNFLKSTIIWVISSFSGVIQNFSPLFNTLSMACVNVMLEKLNTTLTFCLFSLIFSLLYWAWLSHILELIGFSASPSPPALWPWWRPSWSPSPPAWTSGPVAVGGSGVQENL